MALRISVFDDIEQRELDQVVGDDRFGQANRYIRRTRQPYIALEGVLRLVQSIINQPFLDDLNLSNYNSMFRDLFTKCAIPPVELGLKMVNMIEPVYDFSQENVVTMQNICFVLMQMIELYDSEEFLFDDQTVAKMFEYLSGVLIQSDHFDTLYYAVTALVKLTNSTAIVIEDQLRDSLRRLEEYLTLEDNVTMYDFANFSTSRYKTAFLARWLLQRHPHAFGSPSPPALVSPDGVAVLCSISGYQRIPVRSAFAVTSGVFYYEGKLIK